MNIQDVEIPEKEFPSTLSLWDDIFTQQLALMRKYDEIETANGFIVPSFANLNSRFLQHRVKDFFWRVTEELGEALEALDKAVLLDHLENWRKNWDRSNDTQHFFEELADALHFFVEASIMCQYSSRQVDSIWQSITTDSRTRQSATAAAVELMCLKVVKSLGLSANCLKNKPWKQTEVETDIPRFQMHFSHSWTLFLRMLADLGLKDFEIHNLYTKKNHVNQFRQRSLY